MSFPLTVQKEFHVLVLKNKGKYGKRKMSKSCLWSRTTGE